VKVVLLHSFGNGDSIFRILWWIESSRTIFL